MWRDTGNSRYLADAFGWHALPLTDGRLADAEVRGQLGHATGKFDRFGSNVGHKRKVSHAYRKVNEAFDECAVRGAYSALMFKDTLKKLRKSRGMTQKQLAAKIGVTAPAVTQWEAGGGIDMPNLQKLAKALETPLKVLTDAWGSDPASHNSDSPAENLPDLNVSKDNNEPVVTQRQEGNGMGDGLRDAVIKDLMERLARVETKLFTEAEEPAKADPRRRRR